MSVNYECDGQIELTEYLKSQIKSGKVMDLTAYINSKGKSQYEQVGELVENSFYRYAGQKDFLDRITNDFSVWVLEQSMMYMDYLREN